MATRIGIIGAGGIGSIVGGMLTRAGRDVTLVDQWPEHVEAVKRDGLRITGVMGEHVVPVRALHVHELQGVDEPFDMVFVAVKSYDTDWAAMLMLPHLAPDGVMVSFQNGINDERVAAVAGRERTLGCVVAIGAAVYEPGVALCTNVEPVGFKIGELDGDDTRRIAELARIMGDVGPSEATTHLWVERWSKLAGNCMGNALTALAGYTYAEALRTPETRRIQVQVAAECVRVARAAGHEIKSVWGIPAGPLLKAAGGRVVEEVETAMLALADRIGGAARASFLQDVLKGRRTEIEYLNGYVSAEGRRLGVPTPFNDATVEAVKRHPAGR
ncbi:MAG: ketopantoate reductase family protein, partial [Gemmatimonadetes bacterium]|nr:ketopantoate reductase family protein [Gemmatimonadota bacterium]